MESIPSLIPHREPFLFVDRILERSSDSIVTEWTVRFDADFLRGHYPGAPVVPGVLLCESVFQTGALLLAGQAEDALGEGSFPVLARIESARFKRIVRPGERLENRVVLRERLGSARWLRGHSTVGEDTVLRVDFTVSAASAGAMASTGR